MANNTRNYTEQGGEKWVIGGILEIKEGATVTGLPPANPAESQSASTATTVSALKEDFNALLAKLKTAGFMAADTDN